MYAIYCFTDTSIHSTDYVVRSTAEITNTMTQFALKFELNVTVIKRYWVFLHKRQCDSHKGFRLPPIVTVTLTGSQQPFLMLA